MYELLYLLIIFCYFYNGLYIILLGKMLYLDQLKGDPHSPTSGLDKYQ